MYIPCVCIVALSWVSFWIDPDAIPARVGLSITTVLTICYMLGSVNSKLPRVSYLKAIDYFLLMSFGFIFFTLVEYVFVLRYSRKMKYVGSFTPGQRTHLDLAERGEWVRKINTLIYCCISVKMVFCYEMIWHLMADNRWTKKIEGTLIPSPLRATSPHWWGGGRGGVRDLIPQHKRRWRYPAVLVKTRFGWLGVLILAGLQTSFWATESSHFHIGEKVLGSIFPLSAFLSQLNTTKTFLRASPLPEIDRRFEVVKPFALHPLPTSHRLKINTSWI